MLRKNKKAFTLIELLVIVAIIGVLVLLAIRTYIPQRERAANSIAKANAATIQTMLVGYMGDHDVTEEAHVTAALGAPSHTLEDMLNPYGETLNVYVYDPAEGTSDFSSLDGTLHKGKVIVLLVQENILRCNALDKNGEPIWNFTHALPANKN